MSDFNISVKWAPARLLGPAVETDLALDFIRRTDTAMHGEAHTNNRAFARDFSRWMGGLAPDYGEDGIDWQELADLRRAYASRAGLVRLEHLSPSWIACSWIGGPHGMVSPSGMVMLAKNFGKYPTVKEVERDLDLLAENFKWLTFDLAVWGHSWDEEAEGLPSCMWRLEDGSWSRAEPKILPVSAPDTVTSFIAGLHNPMREQTWDLRHIDRMWGERHRADLAAARKEMSE